jgi:hypothetical protein
MSSDLKGGGSQNGVPGGVLSVPHSSRIGPVRG